MKLSHCLIGFPTGFGKGGVSDLKLFFFLFRIVERLGHPDARNAALQRRIDLRHRFAAFHKGVPHPIAQQHGDNQQKRHAGKNNQRKPAVDRKKIAKRKHHRYGGDQNVFGSVVGKLADIHQVVCHTGHDLSGLVAVVKAVRQFFQVAEHIAPHLRLHPHAHHVTVILDKIVQQHPHEIQPQQNDTEDHDHPVFLIGNQVVEHMPGHDRIHNGDQGNQQRRQHIHGKDQPVRLIIGQKSF